MNNNEGKQLHNKLSIHTIYHSYIFMEFRYSNGGLGGGLSYSILAKVYQKSIKVRKAGRGWVPSGAFKTRYDQRSRDVNR